MATKNPGKILIVDDDPDIQAIYTEVLKKAGYLIDNARDGQEGYTKLMQGGYDLVFLDVMMPKIDGLSILKKLKENPPSVYNGSIIVLSSLNSDDVIKSAMANGAKGYILKSSVTPNQVLDKVEEILQNN